VHVLRRVNHRAEVVQREAAGVVLERPDEDDRGGEQQEGRRVGEERDDAEPGQR